MRLLNATTLRIETVFPGKEPPYAILSHRWTDDEVLLGDIQSGKARSKASFAKLKGCCDVALGQGLSHVWIDTCCIDQTSSAELSEAINSMFRWYRGAQVCYAYLFDACVERDYLQSQWFDRGWTLQELIAPKEVQFYARDWTQFGDRTCLSSSLSLRTGIAEEYLLGSNVWNAPIAERMSWAARRETTKPEDIAYCLFGIFNIHMPLLYGEGGENAFIRLQREIISTLNFADDSWLAWGLNIAPKSKPTRDLTCAALDGMLARSPSLFEDSRDVVLVQRGAGTVALGISMTNADIHAQLPVVTEHGRDYLLLGCHMRSDYWNVISIPVINHLGRYYRTRWPTEVYGEELWSGATAFNMNSTWGKRNGATLKDLILASREYLTAEVTGKDPFFSVRLPDGFRVVEVFPPEAWQPRQYIHIDLGEHKGSELPPPRVVRLERCSTRNGVQDPDHYLLNLSFEPAPDRFAKGLLPKPCCRVGLVPRDSPPLQEDLTGVHFDVAMPVPRTSTALMAEIKWREVYGRLTYVVRVYMEDEWKIHYSHMTFE
ncbi:HET domain protein [Colletotrichum sojae]|uniref:HET domain protein n=1 Tax=Colletotrichum sojae TaxID=2175907 RepID=A0A8H6JBG9_9PEZI|nr:HET domain protein [Colletotrichum sojae]